MFKIFNHLSGSRRVLLKGVLSVVKDGQPVGLRRAAGVNELPFQIVPDALLAPVMGSLEEVPLAQSANRLLGHMCWKRDAAGCLRERR